MALTMIYFRHISKDYQYKSNKELALLEAEVEGESEKVSVKGTGSDDNIGTNLLTAAAAAEEVEGRVETTRRSQHSRGSSSGHRMSAVRTEEADEGEGDDEEELGVSSHAKFIKAFDEGYR
jgi:hypothetical protein